MTKVEETKSIEAEQAIPQKLAYEEGLGDTQAILTKKSEPENWEPKKKSNAIKKWSFLENNSVELVVVSAFLDQEESNINPEFLIVPNDSGSLSSVKFEGSWYPEKRKQIGSIINSMIGGENEK